MLVVRRIAAAERCLLDTLRRTQVKPFNSHRGWEKNVKDGKSVERSHALILQLQNAALHLSFGFGSNRPIGAHGRVIRSGHVLGPLPHLFYPFCMDPFALGLAFGSNPLNLLTLVFVL